MAPRKPEPTSHDAILHAVRALACASDRAAIAGAFVASLGGPPAFWRAPLVALAAAAAVPDHRYRAFGASSPACAECGLLPTNEPEEIHERGQCMPGDLAAAYAILARANAEIPPRPDRAAVARLERILALVGELPATARESALSKAIRAEKLVVGNAYDARHVIETLGACGILQTPEYPGFTTRWTSFGSRQDRPSSRVECDPPIAFWTAGHGVCTDNVDAWFGELGVRVRAASRPVEAAVAKASARAERDVARAARSTELSVGDAVAIHVDDAWYAAVVVDHHVDEGGRVPVLEPVEWRGRAAPSIDEVRGLRAAGSTWGAERKQQRFAVVDLWKRDDPRGRWRTVGGGVPAPDAAHLGAPLGLYSIVRVGRDGAGLARIVEGIRR